MSSKGQGEKEMNSKEIREHLKNKNYDVFGDDLYIELLCFPQNYETIEEMIEDQGDSFWRFLVEDFPDRYEI